ncbi:MAG: CvpA family protein [Bacteroidota bacterium]
MDFLADLSYLDAFISVVAVLGLMRGWHKGLVDQVLGLVGIVAAIILGAMFAGPIGSMVVNSMGLSPRIAGTVGFAVVFAGVMLGVFLLVRAIKNTLSALALGSLDKVGGGAFGGFKALLVLSLMLGFVNMLPLMAGATSPVIGDETRETSMFYEPVRGLAPATWGAVQPILPGLSERLFQAVDDLEAGRFEDDPPPSTTIQGFGD